MNHEVAPQELLRRRLQAVSGKAITHLALPAQFGQHLTQVKAGTQISASAGPWEGAVLVMSGLAGEARQLSSGRRQILGLRAPGDVILGDVKEEVLALTPVTLVDAMPFLRTVGSPDHSKLRRAWLACCRVDEAMLRDQIIRLGRLSAFERVAHFLVETHERLLHVGLATPQAFHLPLRQELIADLLGLSVVHVSRVSKQLRRDGLARLERSYATLLDHDRLRETGAYVSRFPPTAEEGRVGPNGDAAPTSARRRS